MNKLIYGFIPDCIKKNVCAYLLQRYLGQFFEDKLTRDQLDVDLYNGTGSVEKISLDVQALNELGEKQNWPMEFVDGYIEKIFINIPWANILHSSTFVEVKGLKLTVQPKQRSESATSMFESMWNSMTSSMQLAEECAKQEAANAANEKQKFEGIEIFAQTIDSILSRVQVKFIDTIIQLEHVPLDSNTGVGITINIDLISYSDEAGNDPPNTEASDLTNQDSSKAYMVQSFTTKKLSIEGVTLSTVEFLSKARTFARSTLSQNSDKECDDSLTTLIAPSNENFFSSAGIGENFQSTYEGNEEETTTAQQEENDTNDQNRHVIMFGKISGRQEIRVRLKQSEHLVGPKVSIEMNFGMFLCFLSPRQFHVLVELANGLASPDMEDTSNVAPKSRLISKPMSTLDYQRVEQDLQNQLHPMSHFNVGGLQGAQGWSTAALDESTDDGSFLPMKNPTAGMYDSVMSGASSSMESSITSSMTSSVTDQSNRTRRRLNQIETDPTAEISHFHIRIASLILLLLHEDLLIQPTEDDQILAPSSVKQMQQTVKEFFDKVGQFVLAAHGNNDFENSQPILDNACKANHLRLLAAPVQIEGDEKTTLTAFSITGNLTAAKFELYECIHDLPEKPVEYIPLIKFSDFETVNQLNTAKPSFKLNFKHTERTGKNGPPRRNVGPKTDITIALNKCDVEFDITIIDRITALLNPQPICITKRSQYNPWTNKPVDAFNFNSTSLESCVDFKITSISINVKLRFPIPDFRPATDMTRLPWWKRHVRSDYLSLLLTSVSFQTSIQRSQHCMEFNLQCRGLDVFYFETENGEAIVVAKAGIEEKNLSSMQDVFEMSSLNIKITPSRIFDLDDTGMQEIDPMTHSVYGAFENQGVRQPGPFSAKRVMHESDTPHGKLKDDAEELIIPGDRREIHEFVKTTGQNAQIRVEILLPTVSFQLLSKHIYELIYNRINNDLLLWEPSAPKHKSSTVYENLNQQGILNNYNLADGQDIFTMCKSGIQYESDSESSDESDPGSSTIFHSAYDSRMKNSQKQVIVPKESNRQSYFVLDLQIGQGIISVFTPARDVSTNNVIPNQQGEFLLIAENIGLFVVSGYKGDENLGFVCVQISKADLHHCDMTSIPNPSPPIKKPGTTISRHLHQTIFRSEPGMVVSDVKRGGEREMLSIAVRIQANHETHHVKTVRVAIGLNRTTLKHRMCNQPNSWISQLLDFFNVQDYPIPGYHAKDVLTELHLHLWDCAIDYRPLHLPLRSAVTLGNFSMSSNLSAQSNTSTLRFIAEECGLFLSEKGLPKKGIPSPVPVDLKRDYVNVVEIGLFELSLKTNDKKGGVNPHIDLRASNDSVKIHTCADSGRALMKLINYFASDGDLTDTENIVETSSSYSSPRRHPPEQELISVEPPLDISNLSDSQHEYVNELLGEAMRESDISEENEEDGDNLGPPGAQLFFFPDEKHTPLPRQSSTSKTLAQASGELDSISIFPARPLSTANNSDDEFCFIGQDASGLGTFPRNGTPDIKWLTSDPIRIIENHFSIPVGKTDLLKPPKHFPTPVLRYTLCDMTVEWHMYGGNDFKVPDKDGGKKVNFSDAPIGDTVKFSNNSKGFIAFSRHIDKKKENMSWLIKGGVNRNHNVLMELKLNKVRFQHEVYPDTTTQASRQVLIISDVEIRDRLESSQINMFLYQHSSQARPKQTNAHMVVVKALHFRPDSKLKTQECSLKVSLLPIRLNIDQDALLFLIAFFNELGGGNTESSDLSSTSKHNTPTHQPPVMMVSEENERFVREQAQMMVDENLLILLEENKTTEEDSIEPPVSSSSTDNLPIYFSNVIFSPEVLIKLDYHGKRVDMTHGSLPGLLMGLGQLNCSELRLKRINHRHGILGFDKLVVFLLQEWLNDIKKNQLKSLLGGVGPMNSFVQLFQGIRDLVWLPIEQYQKDGRIVRGLQRGANSFTTSTAMAALELTSRIIHLIQITAETAYDMLSPGPSVRRVHKTKGRRKRYHQPQDIREGMTNAYMVVKEGLGETAGTIVQVASNEREQKGYSGAVGGVLRQIPPTIFKPIIIASEATNNVLDGMRSQLVPDARREANQKWRSSDE